MASKPVVENSAQSAAAGGAESASPSVQTYVAALNERIELISAARKTNLKPTRPDDSFFSKLDSALKKTSKFGQKLRQQLPDTSQRPALEKEILSLNLSRYVPEAASAFVDQPKLRLTDIAPMLTMMTSMHQRYYPEFSESLLEEWKRYLAANANVTKNLKAHIRLYSECLLCGMFGDETGTKATTAFYKQALTVLVEHIKMIAPQIANNNSAAARELSGDAAGCAESLQILNGYLQKYGALVFGVHPRRLQQNISNSDGSAIAVDLPTVSGLFVNAEYQTKLRMPLNELINNVCTKLYAEQIHLMKEKQKEILNSMKYRGEVSEDLKTSYEEAKTVTNKIREQTVAMADVLSTAVPPSISTTDADNDQGAETAKSKKAQIDNNKAAEVDYYLSLNNNDNAGGAASSTMNMDVLWNDSEDKMFYTSLPRLDEMLPEGCFKHTKPTAPPASSTPAVAAATATTSTASATDNAAAAVSTSTTADIPNDNNANDRIDAEDDKTADDIIARGESELLALLGETSASSDSAVAADVEMTDVPPEDDVENVAPVTSAETNDADTSSAVSKANAAKLESSNTNKSTTKSVRSSAVAATALNNRAQQSGPASASARSAKTKLSHKYSGFDDSYENADDDFADFDDYQDEEAAEQQLEASGAKNLAKTPFDEFLRLTLPNLQSAAQVDAACQQFCMQFNKRDYRLQLINELMRVSYRRFDLFPLYARLAAVLHCVVPEVGNTLVARVRTRFGSILRRHDPTMKVDYKIKVARLLAEFTKFRLFPKAQSLLLIKLMLNHFSQPGVIEMLCSFLECCGRFLYHSPESNPRMLILLETLGNKKRASQIVVSDLQRSVIDAAHLACVQTGDENSFQAAAHRRALLLEASRKRSPYQLYVRHLLYSVLNEETEDVVINALRRMRWTIVAVSIDNNSTAVAAEQQQQNSSTNSADAVAPAAAAAVVADSSVNAAAASDTTVAVASAVAYPISQYIVAHLSQPWRVTYDNIPCLASVVAGLAYYRPSVGADVADNIIEELRLLMELGVAATGAGGDASNSGWSDNPHSITLAVHKQRAIASARYLGELYCYKLAEKNVLYAILYALIFYGSTTGVDLNPILDPSWHLTRLRQAIVILAACGEYFMRGNARRKLDMYLVYLRRYYWAKRGDVSVWHDEYNPFPTLVRDEYERTMKRLRPEFKILDSWEEAHKAVVTLEQELMQENVIAKAMSAAASNAAAVDTEDDDDDDDEEDDIDDVAVGGDGVVNTHHGKRTAQTDGKNNNNSLAVDDAAGADGGASDDDGYGGNPERQAEDALAAQLEALMLDAAHQSSNATTATSTAAGAATATTTLESSAKSAGGSKSAAVMNIPLEVKSEFSATRVDGNNVLSGAKVNAAKRYAADADQQQPPPQQVMKFAVMKREKNNKQAFKQVRVTEAEPFMSQLISRAQEHQKERVQIKRLTLGMNKRQELEEFYSPN